MGRIIRKTVSVTAAGLPAGYAAGGSVGANTATMTLPGNVVGVGRIRSCNFSITPASANFVSTGATFNVWVWKLADAPAAVADAATIAVTAAHQMNSIARFVATGTAMLGPLGTTVVGTSAAIELNDVVGIAEGAAFDFGFDGLALTADRTFSVQFQATGTWDPGVAATIAQTLAAVFDIEIFA